MLFNRKPERLTAQLSLHGDGSDQVMVRKPNGAPVQTLIDASATIAGDLHSEGDIQLDGHICGNVQCARLIVGGNAAITGAVTAGQVVVRGRITGTIRARLVILQETALVESDIIYNLLGLDEGARFEGTARRRPDPLQDEDASSALADLKRMMAGHRAGKARCAAEASGRHPETAPSLDGQSGRRPKPEPDLGDRADG